MIYYSTVYVDANDAPNKFPGARLLLPHSISSTKRAVPFLGTVPSPRVLYTVEGLTCVLPGHVFQKEVAILRHVFLQPGPAVNLLVSGGDHEKAGT